MPPQAGDVDELGMRVEQRRQCIRISLVPRFHEEPRYALGPISVGVRFCIAVVGSVEYYQGVLGMDVIEQSAGQLRSA